jgi:hypothetical protein
MSTPPAGPQQPLAGFAGPQPAGTGQPATADGQPPAGIVPPAGTAPAEDVAAPPAAGPVPQAAGTGLEAAVDPAASGPVTETSLIGRFVAILTPVFAVAAGWLAGVVAKAVPGAHLDQAELVSFMVAASASAIAAAWKWLQGWQQHEQLVADGKARPVKPGR